MWVVRDKDGWLYLYWDAEPIKSNDGWRAMNEDYLDLEPSLFPEVQWQDSEPTEVELVIKRRD